MNIKSINFLIMRMISGLAMELICSRGDAMEESLIFIRLEAFGGGVVPMKSAISIFVLLVSNILCMKSNKSSSQHLNEG